MLVVSEKSEEKHYKGLQYPNLIVVNYPNNPLGLKWQFGVRTAKKINAHPVIILGSDDIVNKDFTKNAIRLINRGFTFIGLKQFWVEHKRKRYLINYKPEQPIGGGRIYSANFLDLIGWKIFEAKERHLDDFGFKQVILTNQKYKLIDNMINEGLEVTAIKGDWSMMNPFNPYHPNLMIINTTTIK